MLIFEKSRSNGLSLVFLDRLRKRSCTAPPGRVRPDGSARQHGDRRVAPAAKRPFPQPVGECGVQRSPFLFLNDSATGGAELRCTVRLVCFRRQAKQLTVVVTLQVLVQLIEELVLRNSSVLDLAEHHRAAKVCPGGVQSEARGPKDGVHLAEVSHATGSGKLAVGFVDDRLFPRNCGAKRDIDELDPNDGLALVRVFNADPYRKCWQ